MSNTRDETIAFLRKILPAIGAYLMRYVARTTPLPNDPEINELIKGQSQGRRSGQLFAITVEELADLLLAFSQAGYDTWHACASFKEARHNTPKWKLEALKSYAAFFPQVENEKDQKAGRKKENVHRTKSFWGDVDVGPDKQFKSREEAIKAVTALCDKYNLPYPIFVNSGNGIHFYWLLTEEVEPGLWELCANGLKCLFDKEGINPVHRITDVASILRTPGTYNYKDKKKPLPVEIDPQSLTHPPCTLEQLAILGKLGTPLTASRKTTTTTKRRLLDDASVPAIDNDYPPSYAVEIIKRCLQLQHIFDKNDKGERFSEPLWYTFNGLLMYCVDGEKCRHDLSSGDDRYKWGQTQAKGEQWRDAVSGPPTCEKFNKENPGVCEQCQFWTRIKSPIVLGIIEDDIAELNKKFFMIRNVGNKCAIGEIYPNPDGIGSRLRLQDPKHFTIYYSNRRYSNNVKKKLGEAWIEHPMRRQYEGIDMMPNAPKELPNGTLNLWDGFAVKPIKGDWSLMQGHIENILADGNKEAAEYILNWLAWAFQHPELRAEVVLVLIGDEGAGKGVLANCLVHIFGSHGKHIDSARHLTGDFNEQLRHCLLAYVNEAYWAGDKKGEARFKAMITDPWLTIEEKFFTPTPWPNRLHIIQTGNAAWAVPAGHNARRYVVLNCSNHYAEKPDATPEERREREEYFKKLFHEMEHGGREAMLHDLRNRNLKDWHPRQIYKGEGLQKQKALSLGPLDKWMETLLQDGILPVWSDNEMWGQKPGFVMTEKLMEDVLKRVSRHDANFIGQGKLAEYFREHWKDLVTKYRAPEGGARGWVFAPLSDMRAAWKQRFGKWPWDHPDLKEWHPYKTSTPIPTSTSLENRLEQLVKPKVVSLFQRSEGD
jgi:hypothetical protein